MSILTKSVCVKQWHLFAMLLLSGYAAGAMLAKMTTVFGF